MPFFTAVATAPASPGGMPCSCETDEQYLAVFFFPSMFETSRYIVAACAITCDVGAAAAAAVVLVCRSTCCAKERSVHLSEKLNVLCLSCPDASLFRPFGAGCWMQWRRRAHPRLSLVLAVLCGFAVGALPMSAILIGINR